MISLRRLCGVWTLTMTAAGSCWAQDLTFAGLPRLEETLQSGRLSPGAGALLSPVVVARVNDSLLVLPILESQTDDQTIQVRPLQDRLDAGRRVKQLALELVGEPILKAYIKAIDQIAWLSQKAAEAPVAEQEAFHQLIRRWEQTRDRQQLLLIQRTKMLTPERRKLIFTDIASTLQRVGLPIKESTENPAFAETWFHQWEILRSGSVIKLTYRLVDFSRARQAAFSEYQDVQKTFVFSRAQIDSLQATWNSPSDLFVEVTAQPESKTAVALDIGLSEEGLIALYETAGPVLLPVAIEASLRYDGRALPVQVPVMSAVCLQASRTHEIALCS